MTSKTIKEVPGNQEYIYGISEGINNEIKLVKLKVSKVTAAMVYVKDTCDQYGYKSKIPKNEVCLTAKEAVEAFIETKEDSIDRLQTRINEKNKQIENARGILES